MGASKDFVDSRSNACVICVKPKEVFLLLDELLDVVKERVSEAFLALGIQTFEIADLNERREPRASAYARVGIVQTGHTDQTVSSDMLQVAIQVFMALPIFAGHSPQQTQFKAARALHEAIFGPTYEKTIVQLSECEAYLIPVTRTTFLTDLEMELMQDSPTMTCLNLIMQAEIPLSGRVYI